MKETFWVYILLCSDKSFYTGTTSDLRKRLSEHQAGIKQGYTRSRRPVKLVFSEMFYNYYDAFSAEHQIKGWTRAKKQALIDRDFELLVRLSNHNKGRPSTSSG